MNPKRLLTDEPTGNLHSSHGEEIVDLCNRLNAEGTTVVPVTHSEKNPAYRDRVIQLRDGWIINN
jgi:putative ABC transport system ATP-binding protein